jgi:hypothetical protein
LRAEDERLRVQDEVVRQKRKLGERQRRPALLVWAGWSL